MAPRDPEEVFVRMHRRACEALVRAAEAAHAVSPDTATQAASLVEAASAATCAAAEFEAAARLYVTLNGAVGLDPTKLPQPVAASPPSPSCSIEAEKAPQPESAGAAAGDAGGWPRPAIERGEERVVAEAAPPVEAYAARVCVGCGRDVETPGLCSACALNVVRARGGRT